MTFLRCRAASRWLVAALALAALQACRDAAPEPLPFDEYVTCLVDRTAAAVRCVSGTASEKIELDRSGSAIVLTGQHADVAVLAEDAAFADSTVRVSLSVKNLAGQPIGTVNGRTADARGIRLVFVPPADTGDSIPLVTPLDGPGIVRDSAASAPAPALRIAEVVDSGAVSNGMPIVLRMPKGVRRAKFAAIVVAPVQFPGGWVRLVPRKPGVISGKRTQLVAATFDALGRQALPVAINWTLATRDPGVTLSSKGEIESATAGAVRVVASCNEDCLAAPDTAFVPIAPPGAVTLTVQPRARFVISRYIYGVNFLTDDGSARATLPPWYGASVPSTVTLNRLGGNRFSAYNWTTNFSNAGADYRFQNDRYLEPTTTPGEAVRRRVADAAARGAGAIVTVPMLPFVAANDKGVPLDTSGATHPQRMHDDFVPNRAAPAAGDPPGTVYQRDFIAWINTTFPDAARDSLHPIFFSLDNEPDIWHSTHREIMSDTAGGRRLQTYDGFAQTSITFARMIKSVQPRARVFGPATATITGILTLGQHPDTDPVHGSDTFLEVYLAKFRDAEATIGRRLLDVLDVHWYPEMGTRTGAVADDMAGQDSIMRRVRLDATRSLWDSTFNEGSWVSRSAGGAIELIPRLRRMVAQNYPGTALSISEYFYGRGGDIDGGIAQADALGIFGREGLFAATMWPHANPAAYGGSGARAYDYIFGAFSLFRNFDGAGGQFGGIGLRATSSDPDRLTIYASERADGKRVLVITNHTDRDVDALIPMASGPQPTSAQVWTMRVGSPVPARGADLVTPAGGALPFRVPALSASTLLLDP